MTLQDRRRLLCVLMAFVFAALLPSQVHAGPSRLGDSFNASGAVGIGSKVTDIAYDPVNDVYMMVSGPRAFEGGHVSGRFIQGDGTLLLATLIKRFRSRWRSRSCRASAYSPALGGFLVTLIDHRVSSSFGQVWGRFVKFSAGGVPAFVTGRLPHRYGAGRRSE